MGAWARAGKGRGGGLRSGQEALENPWQLIPEANPSCWLPLELLVELTNTAVLSRNPSAAAHKEPHSDPALHYFKVGVAGSTPPALLAWPEAAADLTLGNGPLLSLVRPGQRGCWPR